MTTLTLTILDVSGIQSYLFASNRMAHNIGASWLVEQAASDEDGGWVRRALQQARAQTDSAHIWQPASRATAEVVYCGGGNAVLLFKDGNTARSFVRQHSRIALENARGLRVVAHHVEFDWERQSFSDVYTQALKDLARRKMEQPHALPMPSLGVTAACEYTGAPAVEYLPDPDGRPRRVSAEIRDKQQARHQARARWRRTFCDLLGESYEFTEDFNEMGEERNQFLAVVHADGNGIGQRKEDLCKQYPCPAQNAECVLALGNISGQLRKAGQEAFEQTLSHMIAWLKSDQALPAADRRFAGWDGRSLPFLPLVYGGDDVTFVCDGRLGLSLAAIYLRRFSQHSTDFGGPLHACAGVAIVKNRYPFAQAYRMAEALSAEAKRLVKEKHPCGSASGLDWHFAISGAVRDLGGIRRAEYELPHGHLHARPRLIDSSADPIRDWDTFRHLVAAFGSGEWRERRNKVKALREWLREGPAVVKMNLKAFEIGALPLTKTLPGVEEDGWYGKTCAYFDAIEALDLFIDLE